MSGLEAVVITLSCFFGAFLIVTGIIILSSWDENRFNKQVAAERERLYKVFYE